MALTFGADVADRANHGAGASLATLDPLTVWAWIYPTTITSGRRFMSKYSGANQGWEFSYADGSGDLRFTRNRATTNSNYRATAPGQSVNTWYFIATTWDSSATPSTRIYQGSLTGTVVEVTSFSASTSGSGGPYNDSADSLEAGNLASFNSTAFQGRIASYGVINRVLTLGELIALQNQPTVVANTKLFVQAGWNGISTQPDWSGNGNSGTLTSTAGFVTAAHVPLRPAFAAMTRLRYAVAVVAAARANRLPLLGVA